MKPKPHYTTKANANYRPSPTKLDRPCSGCGKMYRKKHLLQESFLLQMPKNRPYRQCAKRVQAHIILNHSQLNEEISTEYIFLKEEIKRIPANPFEPFHMYK